MENKTELWARLKAAEKPIVLYGMGNGADRILDILQEKGIAVDGIFASDGFVRHQQFRGFTVTSYAEQREQWGDMIILLAFGSHRAAVMDRVKELMKEQEVYVPDVPVAGDALFDLAFVRDHRSALEKVYSLLADEASKFAFESVVLAKLTGDPRYLFRCETEPFEAYQTVGIGFDECYLDLGAYTGDTALRFAEWTGENYNKIIAVEPDCKNFAKLLKNTAHLPNVEAHHLCIDREDGAQRFEMDGGRKSRSGFEGGSLVEARSVDSLLDGQAVTWIKMDVEGMERAAIEGAKQTLLRFGPRMDVAAYHRSEDLFDLPLLIHSIRKDARFFFRHFSALPAWDSNFYIQFEDNDI